MLIEPIAQAVEPYASLITFVLVVILMALFAIKYRLIKIRKRRGNPSLRSIYDEIGQQHDDTRDASDDLLTALIEERKHVRAELATIIKNTKPSDEVMPVTHVTRHISEHPEFASLRQKLNECRGGHEELTQRLRREQEHRHDAESNAAGLDRRLKVALESRSSKLESEKARCKKQSERIHSLKKKLRDGSSEDEVMQRIIETLRADSIGLWNANQDLKRRIRELEAQNISPLPTEESSERDNVLRFFGKLAKSLAANPEGK